jgi:phosphoglucomutase
MFRGSTHREHYQELTAEFGTPYYIRIDAPATPPQKTRLEKLSADAVATDRLAGETITAKLTVAPGNGAPIGGLKVVTDNGCPAVRHGEHLQDLCGELQGSSPPGCDRERGSSDREPCT